MKFLRKDIDPGSSDNDGGQGWNKEAGMSAGDAGQMNAFLGKGCSFDGKLSFEGKVRVDGQFTGEIHTKDVLEIGPDAEVKAELHVGSVVVGGRIEGNIHAAKRADLLGTASIQGNIEAPVVTMQEGAQVDGALQMGSAPGQPAAARSNAARSASAKPQAAPTDKKDGKPKPDPTVLP